MDRADIAELYERYGYAVHRRCWRLLGSEAEADDALQEVFVRVMRYGAGFVGDAPLPWLYRIADRHCFDRLRARKRREQPDETERIVATLDRAQAAERGSLGGGPGGGDGRETLQAVARALSACREAVQQAAILYYVDEMTQDEVASAVGVSRKTVRERLASFVDTAREVLRLPARRGGT
jgi:RNA polymerase sigma factor (sigma-70 family)